MSCVGFRASRETVISFSNMRKNDPTRKGNHVTDDLDIARQLARQGVPIFLAERSEDFPHGGSDGKGYWLPKGWQRTAPDPSILDDYEPGMAVCAVMGHAVDGIDLDPRSGGDLPTDLQPRVYGRQRTPSGGTHELVAPLGVRSKDGVFPGVDVKAGRDGAGVGFLYIAPTEKLSHGGELVTYEWETEPNLDALELIGNDLSGSELAATIGRTRAALDSGRPSYEGLAFDELTTDQQTMARNEYQQRLSVWRVILDESADWPEGYRDSKGRGWEALTRDCAWAIASLAVNPWTPLDEADARDVFESLLPDVIANDPKCRGKWYEGLLGKAAARPVDLPPWSDFEPIDIQASMMLNLPDKLDEKHMADWLAEVGLTRNWCHTRQQGWFFWTGKRWEPTSEDKARHEVGTALARVHAKAVDAGVDGSITKRLGSLLTASKIYALTNLVRGAVQIDDHNFDARPDLLNVSNGVVDLRTSELLPHDRNLYLTKITEVNYVPGATHPDWTQALTALDPEVADWMQVRFGQGATGYMTPDDILPIGQGQGSNGKTTLISAVRGAMGEHAVTVPEKLLRPGSGDHSTELTSLLGARLAFIDETPEAGGLNMPRVKTVLGSPEITARKVARNNITWRSTHSLFVMTNYKPVIKEADFGSWRRLALVKFEKTFPRDERFRSRITQGEGGVWEAVLAWIVEGARIWYDAGRVMPEAPQKVQKDTQEWRADADLMDTYIAEHLVFDPDSCIIASDLLDDFNDWVTGLGQHPWSSQTVSNRIEGNERIGAHGVKRMRKRTTPKMLASLSRKNLTPINNIPTVWSGVRFADDMGETSGDDLL